MISSSDSNATSVNVWRDKVVITCDSTTIANALILPAQKLLWGNTYPLHIDEDELFEEYSDSVQRPIAPPKRPLPLLHARGPVRKKGPGRPPKRPIITIYGRITLDSTPSQADPRNAPPRSQSGAARRRRSRPTSGWRGPRVANLRRNVVQGGRGKSRRMRRPAAA